MRLDQYISELLYEHECVIIPGFGGIVSNYRPAFLNPARHTFSPPSKKLAFNASLRTNDGLLAMHLCKQLSVNYTEANNYISDFVNDCLNALEAGEKLILDKVGVVYLDNEKNLQFMPDASVNYLKSSFGLFTLHSPPVKREETQPIPIIPEIKARAAKKRKIASWRLIEVVPVAAILTLMMFNPSLISRLNDSVASINPFSTSTVTMPPVQKENTADFNQAAAAAVQEEKKVEPDAVTLPEEAPVIKMQPDLIAAGSETAVSEVKPVEEKEIETRPAEYASPNVTSIASQKLYYVIGGCFKVEENAQSFLQQSLNDGHQAAIIGRNKNGLVMVSLYSTASRADALRELQAIQQKADAQAWLLRQ